MGNPKEIGALKKLLDGIFGIFTHPILYAVAVDSGYDDLIDVMIFPQGIMLNYKLNFKYD